MFILYKLYFRIGTAQIKPSGRYYVKCPDFTGLFLTFILYTIVFSTYKFRYGNFIENICINLI